MLDRDALNHFLVTLFGLNPLEEPEFVLLQELVGQKRAAVDGSLHPETSRKILALSTLMPGVSFVVHSAGGAWEKWLEDFQELGLDAVGAIPDGASPSRIRRTLDEARQGHHRLVSISRGVLGDVEIDRALPVVAQDRGIFCVVVEGALLGELDRRCFGEIVDEVDRSFAPSAVAVFLGAPDASALEPSRSAAPVSVPSVRPGSLTEEEKAALFTPLDLGAYETGEEEIFDEEALLRTVIREPVRRPTPAPEAIDPLAAVARAPGGPRGEDPATLSKIISRSDLEALEAGAVSAGEEALPEPIGELSPLDAILSRAEAEGSGSSEDEIAELPADLLIAEEAEGEEGFDQLLGMVTQAGTARIPDAELGAADLGGGEEVDALDALLASQQAEAEAADVAALAPLEPELSEGERASADQASSLLDNLLAFAEDEEPAEGTVPEVRPSEGGLAAVEAASERENDLASLLASFGGDGDGEVDEEEDVEVLDESDLLPDPSALKSIEDTFKAFDPSMRVETASGSQRDESAGAVSRIFLPGEELEAALSVRADEEAGNTTIVFPEETPPSEPPIDALDAFVESAVDGVSAPVVPIEASATTDEVDALDQLLDQVLDEEGATAPLVDVQGTAALEAFLTTGEMPAETPEAVYEAEAPEAVYEAEMPEAVYEAEPPEAVYEAETPEIASETAAEDSLADAPEVEVFEDEAVLAAVGVGAPDGAVLPPPRPEEGEPLLVDGADELLTSLGLEAPDEDVVEVAETPDEELEDVLVTLGREGAQQLFEEPSLAPDEEELVEESPIASVEERVFAEPSDEEAVDEGGVTPVFDEAIMADVLGEMPTEEPESPPVEASPPPMAAADLSDQASAEAIEDAIRRLAQEELAEQIEVDGGSFGAEGSVFGQAPVGETSLFGQTPTGDHSYFGQTPTPPSAAVQEPSPASLDESELDPDSPAAIEAALRRLAEEELAEELGGEVRLAAAEGTPLSQEDSSGSHGAIELDPDSPEGIEAALRRLAEEELFDDLEPSTQRALPPPPTEDLVSEDAIPAELLGDDLGFEDEQIVLSGGAVAESTGEPAGGGDSLEAIEEALRRLAEEEVREEGPAVVGASLSAPPSLALPPPPSIEAPELSSDVDALLADLGLDEDLTTADEEIVSSLESELADVGDSPVVDDGALPFELADIIGETPQEERAAPPAPPRPSPKDMSLEEILRTVELVEPEAAAWEPAPSGTAPEGSALDDFLVAEGLAPEPPKEEQDALPSVEDLMAAPMPAPSIDPEEGRLTAVILPDEDLAASLAALSEESASFEGPGEPSLFPAEPTGDGAVTNVILPGAELDEAMARLDDEEPISELPLEALVPEARLGAEGRDPEEGTVTSVVLPGEDLAASLAALAVAPETSSVAVPPDRDAFDPEEGAVTSVILPGEDLAESLAALAEEGVPPSEEDDVQAALAALDADLSELQAPADVVAQPLPVDGDDFGLSDALEAMDSGLAPQAIPEEAVAGSVEDASSEALSQPDFEMPEGIDLAELDALDGPSSMETGALHEIEEISLAEELADFDAAEEAKATVAQGEVETAEAPPQALLDDDLATLQGTLQDMLDGFDDDLNLAPSSAVPDEPVLPEPTVDLPEPGEGRESFDDLLVVEDDEDGTVEEISLEDLMGPPDGDETPETVAEGPPVDTISLEDFVADSDGGTVPSAAAVEDFSLEELAGGEDDDASLEALAEERPVSSFDDELSLEELARMAEAEVEAQSMIEGISPVEELSDGELSLEELVAGQVHSETEKGILPDLRPDDYLPSVEEEAEEIDAPSAVEGGGFGIPGEEVDLSLAEIAAGATLAAPAMIPASPSLDVEERTARLPVEQAFDLQPELRRLLFDLQSDFAAILDEAGLLRDSRTTRLDEVEAQAVDVARSYPEHAAAAFVAGVLLVWERHSMDGLVFLERCGELTAAAGDHGNRLVLFEFLAKRFPEDLGIRERLAEVQCELGQLDEAVSTWCELGEALEDAGSPSGAQRYYDLAARTLPDRGDVLGRAVAALRSRGLESEALSRVNVFLDAHPDDPFAMVEKGIALHRSNRGMESERLFDRAIKIAWEGAEDLLVLREAFLRGGHDDRARSCLDQAGAVDPTHDGVRAAHAVVEGGFLSTEDLLGEAEAILEAPQGEEYVISETYEVPQVDVETLYARARRGGAKGLRKIDELERLEAEIGRSRSLEDVADNFLAELLRRFIEVGDLLRVERPAEAKLFYERGRSYLQYFGDPTVLFLWSEQVEKKLALVEKEIAA